MSIISYILRCVNRSCGSEVSYATTNEIYPTTSSSLNTYSARGKTSLLLMLPLALTYGHLVYAAPLYPPAAEVSLASVPAQSDLGFEKNIGQFEDHVLFAAVAKGYSVYLTKSGAELHLPVSPSRGELALLDLDKAADIASRRISILKLSSAGSRVIKESAIVGQNLLPGVINRVFGNDPAQWHTNIQRFAKVLYRDVYPGIDLVFYGKNGELEYDYIVHPSADPSNIVVEFNGNKELQTMKDGSLRIDMPDGEKYIQQPAIVYQSTASDREFVNSRYRLASANTVEFALDEFDRDRPLVIDPVLTYSGYLGGNGTDQAWAIDTAADNSVYVVGETNSTSFYGFNGSVSSGQNAFVSKFDLHGALEWTTIFGGSSTDYAKDVSVGDGGEIWITGSTESSNFPAPGGLSKSNQIDAFAVKFDSNGMLTFGTHLGGGGMDRGNKIVTDTIGGAWVGGSTSSFDFVVTSNAFVDTFYGPLGTDSFFVHLYPTGSVKYGTYLGSSLSQIQGLDLGGSNDEVYFAEGSYDEVIVRRISEGGGPTAHQYIGGGNAYATSLRVASNGDVWVVGQIGVIRSNDFPVTSGAYQSRYGGGLTDGFFAKLNAELTSPYFISFLGGSSGDEIWALSLDNNSGAWITGYTESADFPTFYPAYQTAINNPTTAPCNGQCGDAFVTHITEEGDVDYSTFLSGIGEDNGYGIDVAPNGNIWVAGRSNTGDFPVFGGGLQNTTGTDAFVARFEPIGMIAPKPGTTLSGSDVSFEWSGLSDITGWWLYIGSTPGGRDLFDSGNLYSDTSVAVTDLPTHGRSIYVQLFYKRAGVDWESTSYTYTALARPYLYEPVPGSELEGSEEWFAWSDVGGNQFHMYLGSSVGGRDHGEVGLGSLDNVYLTVPTTGNTLFVRFWYSRNGSWEYKDYEYTEYNSVIGGGNAPPATVLVSPSGSTTNTTPTYTWEAVTAAAEYYLWVNDASGTPIQQTYSAVDAGCGNGTSNCSVTPATTVSGNVTWWVQTKNPFGTGPWSSALTVTVQAEGVPEAATLIRPDGAGGGSLPSYRWNRAEGASWYYLWVDDSTGNIIKQWYTAEELNCSGAGSCRITPTTAVTGNATWWVRTWNSVGYGNWSSSASFSP